MREMKPIFCRILGSVKIFFHVWVLHSRVKFIFHGIVMLVLFYLKETIHKNCFLLHCYVT